MGGVGKWKVEEYAPGKGVGGLGTHQERDLAVRLGDVFGHFFIMCLELYCRSVRD